LGGPSGSGKSFTALRLASALLPQAGRVAVLDSEHGSAELYAGARNPDGGVFDFDVIRLDELHGSFDPRNYVAALGAAARGAYPVVVIDSLSHAWSGEGGVLEQVDRAADRMKGNKFAGWKVGTPMQNRLIDSILSYPGHVLVTMRSKMEYVQEKEGDRVVIRKIGLAPIQRDGIEYEFSLFAELEQGGERCIVTKTRCSDFVDAVESKPGASFALRLLAWFEQAPSVQGRVEDLGVEWDELLVWCREKEQPHPDALPPQRQADLLIWLDSEECPLLSARRRNASRRSTDGETT